jgi:hypothetical protein
MMKIATNNNEGTKKRKRKKARNTLKLLGDERASKKCF